MIIGANFAYGHLPKTGGDAAAVYLRALVPGCRADAPNDPRKHATFWTRSESHGKRFYLMGIRQLAEWTWSLMHEINAHPKLLSLYGIDNAATIDFALSRPFADEYLLSMTQGVTITHWIRQESLFGDLAAFVHSNVRLLSIGEAKRIGNLRTKRGRGKGDPFSDAQCAELCRVNPHWAGVQREAY